MPVTVRARMQPDVIIPLSAALGYAFAALFLKRASDGGAGSLRAAAVTNWVAAALFSLWWLRGGAPFAWSHLWHAMLAGACFFTGQIFTFLALSRGDVSIATPVLGTKVIFVVLFGKMLTSDPVPGVWWIAAVMTAVGTAFLGWSGKKSGRIGAGIALGFVAAACFSMTDILCQMWAPAWGFAHFAPALFWTVAALSLALVPMFREPLSEIPRPAMPWLIAGALLVALQACGVAYSIMVFGSATRTNILYNTRGVWSVNAGATSR